VLALIGVAVLDSDWRLVSAFVASIVAWVLLWLKPWIDDSIRF